MAVPVGTLLQRSSSRGQLVVLADSATSDTNTENSTDISCSFPTAEG